MKYLVLESLGGCVCAVKMVVVVADNAIQEKPSMLPWCGFVDVAGLCATSQRRTHTYTHNVCFTDCMLKP